MSHQQIGGCGTAQVVRRDVIARAGGAGAASENPQNDGKKEFVVKIPHAFVVWLCVLRVVVGQGTHRSFEYV